MEEFDSIPSDALLNRAESAKENADWPEAARLFAELHSQEPENLAVLIFLARTRQELGDTPEANLAPIGTVMVLKSGQAMPTKAIAPFLALVFLASSILPASQTIFTCQMSGQQFTACCCKNPSSSADSGCADKAPEQAAPSSEPCCGGKQHAKPPQTKTKAEAADSCGCCSVTHIDKDSGSARTVEENGAARSIASKSLCVAWRAISQEQFIASTRPTASPPPIFASPPTFILLLQIRR